MSKKFLVQQKVKLTGVDYYSTAVVYATSASELSPFLALLEGEYTVMEEALKGGTATNVTNYDLLTRVSAKAEDTISGYASIFPSQRGFAITNGKSADDIEASLIAVNMFADYPSKKPAVGSVKIVTKNGAK